jgi:hypothetical protein
VTFKDLKKRVSLETTTQQRSNLFEICKDKPFWIWDIEEHKQEDIKTRGYCCFNHIIGLPTKEQIEKPIFDYQKILFDTLITLDSNNNTNNNNQLNLSFKHKHLWVKKATGLGVTEFFLRLMAWLCLRNNDDQNSQMCIVTGPNIDIAIKLFDSKETILDLNGCTIEAHPSNHMTSANTVLYY